MRIEKDGTLHMGVGGGLLVLAAVMLAATNGGAALASLICGLIGVGVLVYGIRLFVYRRKADR